MESGDESDSATAASSSAQEAGKVILVEQGQPRAQIVVPVVRHAAEELSYHVRKATGQDVLKFQHTNKSHPCLDAIQVEPLKP